MHPNFTTGSKVFFKTVLKNSCCLSQILVSLCSSPVDPNFLLVEHKKGFIKPANMNLICLDVFMRISIFPMFFKILEDQSPNTSLNFLDKMLNPSNGTPNYAPEGTWTEPNYDKIHPKYGGSIHFLQSFHIFSIPHITYIFTT